MSDANSSGQAGALVRQAIRVKAFRRGKPLAEHVFQHTPIRIGRLLDNDIVLPFDFASRYHAEIRFNGKNWLAVDLGSKNGLMIDATTRSQEIPLEDGSEFRIQEVTIQLSFEAMSEASSSFNAIREAQTVIGDADSLGRAAAASEREVKSATTHKKPGRSSASSTSGSSSSSKRSERVSHAGHRPSARKRDLHEVHAGVKRPMLDIDAETLLIEDHPFLGSAKLKAVQLVVLWHDQVLETREFAVGDRIVWDWMGDRIHLGTAKSDKSQIKIPKGCFPLANEGDGKKKLKSVEVSQARPNGFRASETIRISLRYVPKSRELAISSLWPEEKLVDPLLMSSAIHGAAAVTALFMAPKHPVKPVAEEPERFATIIMPSAQPTPMEVAVQPTPTPTPPPKEAEPSPTPKKHIAKVKPKPVPKEIELKKVVTMKKLKAPALMRKEDPGVEHKEEPKVAKVMPTPNLKAPAPTPPPDQKVADAKEPPAQGPAEVKAAPTPQPFNAKSVGTLKMLSLLSAAPAANIANTEKIQVSRAPASVPGTMVGKEAVAGTGEIISKLSQSAKGGDTGKGDGVTGVAVGGKNAGGKYQMAGLAGKAGTRKIRGSVLGGATYSELTKNEGLTREQVMKVVQEHQSEIQQCYERSLMFNPDLVGRAEFEWEITPKGDVTFVNVKEATVKDGEKLLGCVKGVFAKMKFPTAPNGEATTPTIGLPFGRL